MNANRRSVLIAVLLATAGTIGKAITGSAQSEAGNGGLAGSSADGGTVVVGGNSSVGCIGANGGISTSDASGGDGNNAIIGSGDVIQWDNIDLNGMCVPGTYAENRHGELYALCTTSGMWIGLINGRWTR